jgi:energy-coupling factor transporter ATP-binding protein EcfA2
MLSGEQIIPASGDGRMQHGIAMWGAPSSGKTTLLAALSLALTQKEEQKWNVTGADEASELKLMDLTVSLAGKREFPDRTAGIERYGWILNGLVPQVIRRKEREVPVRIALDLVDASGEIGNPEQATYTVRRQLVANLARCRGIVFIFDPVREFVYGDAFDHTFGMLVQLAGRLRGETSASNGRLPHHVAVCVTKFDDSRVLETAKRLNMVERSPEDPYGFPRVDDDDAREFFAQLCSVSGSGNGRMVPNLIERYFHEDRVKYFITSAIGFYVDPRINRYDDDDPMNLVPGDPVEPKSGDLAERKPDDAIEYRPRIRGPVYPINVVEPLLWLGSTMTSVQARR